jgi:HD-like signal output (HDOD) protein
MSDKLRIIFVDDEPNVLNGLRRMLRSMRNQWDMAFADGGQKALDALSETPFDVIVSDMRMPGIDGSQLLNKVKEQYPRMIRIALSGQTSKETILRSVGPIHQYLPKPCNAETLKTTISRACSCRNLLTNEKLQGLISQLESLPCMSRLYTQLIEELQSDDASIDKVAYIISHDVAMSAKILQLVNSAFFGVRQYVTDISQAVTLLGLDIVKALVLSVKIFSQFNQIKLDNFSFDTLWEHSFIVGQWSKLIARAENADQKTIDYAMVAGMLHDIGKLVFAMKMSEEYEQVLSLAKNNNITIYHAEKELIGATHAGVGAYLLGLWGFSNSIIEALTFHHRPAEVSTKQFSPLTAVHAANVLAHEISVTNGEPDKSIEINTDYLEDLGLARRLSIWQEVCLDSLKVKC